LATEAQDYRGGRGIELRPKDSAAALKAAADVGYRVISLAYNDTPAVAVCCPRKPDPTCSEKFRRMRIYGDGTAIDPAIDNVALARFSGSGSLSPQ
jgi:hypothetical protein